MNLHTSCLVCNSPSLKKIKGFRSSHLCKCLSCGFVFAQAIPTMNELEEHYECYGRNDYLSPITIKRYNDLLDYFEQFRKTGKLLDVGCGIGYFLLEAKKRNWVVYGTEYTDKAVEICNNLGINMQKGVLDPSNYQPGSFDIITSFEVIEHINNPQREIDHFKQLLREGGLVYITTPNWNSLLRYRFKSAYNVITYPEHLSYYTKSTITKLFKSNGFKKENVQTTGVSITRLKTSSGKSNQAYISKTSDDEILRNKIEGNKLLQFGKNIINRTLSFFGVGDTVKGFFVKK